jgi:hypothetical protein
LLKEAQSKLVVYSLYNGSLTLVQSDGEADFDLIFGLYIRDDDFLGISRCPTPMFIDLYCDPEPNLPESESNGLSNDAEAGSHITKENQCVTRPCASDNREGKMPFDQVRSAIYLVEY